MIVFQKCYIITINQAPFDNEIYYKMQPSKLLDNNLHKTYWNSPIITDERIKVNEMGTIVNNKMNVIYWIDPAAQLSNLHIIL
jgi:hypothetical protein